MLVQIEEFPSMYSRPLLSRRNAPWPSTKTNGSCSGLHHWRMSVNGCHTNRLSQAISSSVFHSVMIECGVHASRLPSLPHKPETRATRSAVGALLLYKLFHRGHIFA